VVTVRCGKRGRTRAIPLDEDALEAIVAWVKSRPPLPRSTCSSPSPASAEPRPLSTRDIARSSGATPPRRTYPTTAAPRTCSGTRSAHLADAGADTAVIRELAGHGNIRTTTIYTVVNPGRLEHAIAERGRRNRGARRAAAGA
jgi:site-specific recombinase XerD